jgi:hypothetical protein
MAPVEPFIASHKSSRAGNVSHFKPTQPIIESVWLKLLPVNPSAVPSTYCSDSNDVRCSYMSFTDFPQGSVKKLYRTGQDINKVINWNNRNI